MDKLEQLLIGIVPGILAIVVVVGWIYATVVGGGSYPDLRDAAIAVLAFYFGGIVHSAGVQSGANAANGVTS